MNICAVSLYKKVAKDLSSHQVFIHNGSHCTAFNSEQYILETEWSEIEPVKVPPYGKKSMKSNLYPKHRRKEYIKQYRMPKERKSVFEKPLDPILRPLAYMAGVNVSFDMHKRLQFFVGSYFT